MKHGWKTKILNRIGSGGYEPDQVRHEQVRNLLHDGMSSYGAKK